MRQLPFKREVKHITISFGPPGAVNPAPREIHNINVFNQPRQALSVVNFIPSSITKSPFSHKYSTYVVLFIISMG